MSDWQSELQRQRRMIARTDPRLVGQLFAMLPSRVVAASATVEPGQLVEKLEPVTGGALLEAGQVGGTLTHATAPSATSLTAVVRGPLVRAEQANLNGAFFAADDLRFGLASVAGGPLTVNHDAYAVGWLESAEMATQPDLGNYIDVIGRVWARRFSQIWDLTEQAIAAGKAALSMECVASAIGCMASGCGVETASLDKACDHILKRTAPRRMIQPTFYGAALVLPPEKPGWPDARLSHG